MENLKNLKIGLVRRGYSATGGAEAYLLRLAQALSETGAGVTLYTSRDWPREAWTVGEIVYLTADSPMKFSDAFEKNHRAGEIILSLERVAGCDVFRAGDGVHASWLARRARHEPWWRSAFRKMNPKHRELLDLEKKIFSEGGAKHVIANSEMVKREIQDFYGWKAERISVVRNGYDPIFRTQEERSKERIDLREQLGYGESQPLVLFTGSGWERKGLRFAVQAMRHCPDAILLVAGRGHWRGRVPVNVRFLGPRKDVPQLCCAADIFVLPTLYDPSSNACLEAMAYGLPIVTTMANGFAELIKEDETGSRIEDPTDIPALAAALSAWCDHLKVSQTGSLQNALRELCSKQAAAFSVERNLRETLKILTEKKGWGS
ncbi:MAG: glycosyltransferase family 4 protein [Chthoniobacterales bacterium]